MRASPSPETWMSDRPPALSPVPLTSMGTLSTPPASEGSSAEKNQARSVPPELSTMAPSTIRSVAVGSSAPVHAVFQSASAPEAAFPVAASAPAAALYAASTIAFPFAVESFRSSTVMESNL